MSERNPTDGWDIKIQEAKNFKKEHSPNWLQMQKYWMQIPPEPPVSQKNRANLVVPLTHPIIETMKAHIMVHMNGDNITTTAEIVGNKDDPETKELNTCLQDLFEYFYGKPETFLFDCNVVSDALIYGNCMVKIMPPDNPEDIVKRELIHIWDALWQPVARNWNEVDWASHEKIVPDSHFEKYKDVYDQKKVKEGLNERNIKWDIRFRSQDVKGNIITEIWDREHDKLITLLNYSTIIRKEKMPYSFPYVMAQDIPEANRIIAMGESELLQYEQITANVFRNLRVDNGKMVGLNYWYVHPNVDARPLVNSEPGGIVLGMLPEYQPKPIVTTDASRVLEFDQQAFWNECQRATGIFDTLRGQTPSKRQSGKEAELYLMNANIRFWMKVRILESTYFLPASNLIVDRIAHSGSTTLFKDITGIASKNELTPASLIPLLKRMRIQSKASGDILNDEQKRMLIAQAIGLLVTVVPRERLNEQGIIDLLLETFPVPQIRKIIVEKEEEIKGLNLEALGQMPSMLGGGGAISPLKTMEGVA